MICVNSTQHEVPAELLAAIGRARLNYTAPRFLYYVVWSWGFDELCGVFGDGPNASYEWFHWKEGKLITSDCGYGVQHIALRDVLNVVDPPENIVVTADGGVILK